MTVRRDCGLPGPADLPERFYEAEVRVEHGSMTGLADYLRDLTEYLGAPGQAVETMTGLGISPSEWYRVALNEKGR